MALKPADCTETGGGGEDVVVQATRTSDTISNGMVNTRFNIQDTSPIGNSRLAICHRYTEIATPRRRHEYGDIIAW
jgi:hypothetical protein